MTLRNHNWNVVEGLNKTTYIVPNIKNAIPNWGGMIKVEIKNKQLWIMKADGNINNAEYPIPSQTILEDEILMAIINQNSNGLQMPNNGNPTLTQSEMFTAFAPIGAGLVTGLTSKYYYKRDTKKSLMYGLGATIGAGIIAHLYDSNLYPKLINSFAG